ncbi:MAG: type II secretion system F family protein [Patescibacteria group bacterium]
MNNIKNFLNQDFKFGNIFKEKIKTKDLTVFFRQLAIMFSANVQISDIFQILLNQEDNKLKPIIKDLLDKVENGHKLSDALSFHPKIFNKYYISILKSGEATGNLDESLNFLADELEDNYDTLSKIKSALTYPIFILITMVGVIGIIITYVIPKMTEVLQETGGELPMITRVLISISSFLVNNIILIIVIIALLVFVCIKYYNTDNGKRFFHSLLLKIPVFGKIFQKIYIARISKNLYVLTRSSVSLIESLSITSDIVGNKIYEDIIDDVSEKIKNGERISLSFAEHKEIPIMFIGMISIGEKTGKLDYVLEKISSFYLRELKNITNSITSLIEPIIMVFLGIVVALIVAAVLLPMYSLSTQI